MTYFAVIDTNVLVSALLKFNSTPATVLQLVYWKTIVPVFNDEILKEYREVLNRPKFKFEKNDVDTVINTIEEFGISVQGKTIDEILPDPKDRVFYEVLMDERDKENAYLVTGNMKHFPTKSFIVTPRQMVDLILNNQ